MQTPLLLKQKKLVILALVLTTSLAFTACTPKNTTSVSTPNTETTPEDNPTVTMPPEVKQMVEDQMAKDAAASPSALTGVVDPETGVRTIDVEAGSFYYLPNTIRVKKGEKVKLVMRSVDMMHDLNIDELKVKVPVTKSGSTATAEFTPTQTGIFEYYCSVGQHRANGQVGTMIVE